MKKSVLNFTINTVMTICMSAILGTGFIIKYILIPGKERWVKYGNNVELYFLEMDRHQWGTIHLILGLVLLALVVTHIFLHWKIICCVFKKLIKQPITKKIVALLFLIFCLALIISPFFIKPKVEPIKKNNRHQVTIVTDIHYEYL
ncbi:DUF4405 domain-containing protein [Flaviramulus sp. BrNp1-15]|uniref:DUF4405 domain-containing protein n=1 Tax=Flaviramulus sp. BrNp1-15 TaxID=2916754 RepID=UPI001EE90E1B|nr:DUF4405 domain-containing protein [Flaviramulus sp. BrNp1-15]ULC57873.1 DUF4405 domain-containing protein [Flaviramulus sp. BrNp1-15]